MTSPQDDGWLLSEPLELLAVEIRVNDPRRVSLTLEPLEPAPGKRQVDPAPRTPRVL